MDKEDAKRWLNRGWVINLEINALEKLKEETFASMISSTASPDAVPVSGSKDPHKFDRYAVLSSTLDERIDELVSIKEEIVRAVSQIDNSRYRTLLISRYTRFMTWERISDEMHYSIRSVMRLHEKALQAITEKLALFGI